MPSPRRVLAGRRRHTGRQGRAPGPRAKPPCPIPSHPAPPRPIPVAPRGGPSLGETGRRSRCVRRSGSDAIRWHGRARRRETRFRPAEGAGLPLSGRGRTRRRGGGGRLDQSKREGGRGRADQQLGPYQAGEGGPRQQGPVWGPLRGRHGGASESPLPRGGGGWGGRQPCLEPGGGVAPSGVSVPPCPPLWGQPKRGGLRWGLAPG